MIKSVAANINLPFRALCNSVLKVEHKLKCSLRQFTSTFVFLNRNFKGLAIVIETLNWRYNCSCTSSESLIHTFFLNGLDKLLNFELSDCHLEFIQFAHQCQKSVTGNARQNSAIKRGSDQFVLSFFIFPKQEEIHGAHFCHIIVQQPKSLVTTVLLSTFPARL